MNLKRAAFSASRWTTASMLISMAIQIAQTAVLARILLPADFGLMAVAASFVAVLSLASDLGLSHALVHYDNVSRAARSSIYWLNVSLALVLMLALMLVAPWIGAAFHSQSLVELLCWSSLVFPLTAAGQQLRALASKDLRFEQLAVIDVASGVGGLVCAIVVALAGGGVYALVAGLLARVVAASVLAWWCLPPSYRPDRTFRPRDAWPYLGFGGYLIGESMANQLRRNADLFVGGLVVGPSVMGVFAVPRELTLRLSLVLNSTVTKVGFPVMSRVKHEPERLRNIYLQTLRMTASVNFPLYVFVGLFAAEIVALLFGPRWQEAAWYLRILAAWGLLRSTGNPVGSLLYATGHTRRAFCWNLGMLILLPPIYWLATRTWGLPGLAVGLLAVMPLTMIPGWRFLVWPCCGASFREYFAQFGAPLACALLAGAVAWLVAHDLPHGTLRLAVGGTVGGVIYLGASWLLNRRWLDAMREIIWPARPDGRQKLNT